MRRRLKVPGKVEVFMSVGDRLKSAREARGLTQHALADLAGLSQSQVSQLESASRDNPAVSTIEKLEAAMRMLPGSIMLEPVDDPTLEDFLRSDVAKDVTPEERDRLRLMRLRMPGETANVSAWY